MARGPNSVARRTPAGVERTLRDAIHSRVARDARLVVAVSGGRDSMVLLDALVRWRADAVVALATFDHATGESARQAADLVEHTANACGVPAVRGRAHVVARTEAAWRSARWEFLRDAAAKFGARIATAHSLDDQIETVFIRALRGAGARGLAALYARDDIARPLLTVSRAAIAAYAALRGVRFIDDPSNRSRAHLRNRVRLDLLPALEGARPGFGASLLELARRAADWRAGVEGVAEALGAWREGASVFVPARALLTVDPRAHAILWPALVAQAGIALDRRGTERLAAFSSTGNDDEPETRRIPLAGGHEVIRRSRTFEIRPASGATERHRTWALQRSSFQ